MNQYGYMALMDDYVFLEDVGRKIGEWGREITQGGFMGSNGRSVGRGRGRGRGGRGGGGRGGVIGSGMNGGHVVQSKREVLKMELDFLDIEMELLPVGMEKRTLNQSTWDSKTHVALLTIQFIFHPPRDPYAPSSQPLPEPFTLLTHRNKLDESILENIQTRILERGKSSKKENPIPSWLTDLVIPPPEDPTSFIVPTCVMPTKVDPLAPLQQSRRSSTSASSSLLSFLRPGHIVRNGYYKLDPRKKLVHSLKHKEFVEFPTIEVWEDGQFSGTIVDDKGSVLINDADDDEGGGGERPKRRKMGLKEGREAINGLVGGYGSDDDNDENVNEEDADEEQNVLDALAAYAGSDDDETMDGNNGTSKKRPAVEFDDDELGDEDAEGETDYEMDDEDEAVVRGPSKPEDLAGMLEKLRRVGALRDPENDSRLHSNLEDDEQIDWGDSDDDHS
ncbi:hypothetical protein ABKN59_000560 [Abortiporus biennis]